MKALYDSLANVVLTSSLNDEKIKEIRLHPWTFNKIAQSKEYKQNEKVSELLPGQFILYGYDVVIDAKEKIGDIHFVKMKRDASLRVDLESLREYAAQVEERLFTITDPPVENQITDEGMMDESPRMVSEQEAEDTEPRVVPAHDEPAEIESPRPRRVRGTRTPRQYWADEGSFFTSPSDDTVVYTTRTSTSGSG